MKHLLRELGVIVIALIALNVNAQNTPAPKQPEQKRQTHARDILARARAANPVRIIKAQAENCGDCGQCWVVFFRCVADPNCGAGQKFCTWIIQSEFCGSWDTRGCWP